MKYNLKFPENANYEYWYLYWIGDPEFKKKKFKCKLFFVNCKELTDKTKLEDKSSNFGELLSIEIPYQESIIYSIGYIFNSKSDLLKDPKSYNRKPLNIDYRNNKSLELTSNFLINIEILDDTNKKGNTEEYLLNSKYPLFKLSDFLNSNSLIIDLNFNKGGKIGSNGKNNMTRCIIPSSVLFSFLYGYSTNLVQVFLENRISFVVRNRDIEFFTEEGKRILQITYDNQIVSEKEMKELSNHYALKERKGLHSINYIGSNILSKVMAGDNNPKLDLILPFNSCRFEVYGKSLGDKLFLVYEINKINLKEYESYDTIRLEKKIQNVNENSNEKPAPKKTFTQPKIDDSNIDLPPLESGDNQASNINQDSVIYFSKSSFSIPIDKKVLRNTEKDKNTSNNIPKKENKDAENINTNLDGDQIDEDSLYNNFCVQYQIFDRHFYIAKIVEALSKNEIVCEYVKLTNENYQNIGFKEVFDGKNQALIIVELQYKKKYYYLIEYTTGYTELISHVNREKQLDHSELRIYLNKCFLYKKLKRNLKLSEIEDKFKSENYKFYKENDNKRLIHDTNTEVYPGIEHQSENMQDFNYLVNHTVQKIHSRMK